MKSTSVTPAAKLENVSVDADKLGHVPNDSEVEPPVKKRKRSDIGK